MSKFSPSVCDGVEYQIHEYSFFAKIDIQTSGKETLDTQQRNILTEPFSGETREITTLTIESIFIDKLETLVDRTHIKDLWDLYFLVIKNPDLRIQIHERVKLDLEMIYKAIEIITEQDYQRLRIEYLPIRYKDTEFEEIKRTVKSYLEDIS